MFPYCNFVELQNFFIYPHIPVHLLGSYRMQCNARLAGRFRGGCKLRTTRIHCHLNCFSGTWGRSQEPQISSGSSRVTEPSTFCRGERSTLHHSLFGKNCKFPSSMDTIIFTSLQQPHWDLCTVNVTYPASPFEDVALEVIEMLCLPSAGTSVLETCCCVECFLAAISLFYSLVHVFLEFHFNRIKTQSKKYGQFLSNLPRTALLFGSQASYGYKISNTIINELDRSSLFLETFNLAEEKMRPGCATAAGENTGRNTYILTSYTNNFLQVHHLRVLQLK